MTKRVQRRNEKLKKADKFHWHEILHVSSIIVEMFEKYIVNNTATQSDKFLVEKTNAIADELWDLYQQISQRRKM